MGYYLIDGEMLPAVIAGASSVLIDVDHALDYVITQKRLAPLSKIVKAFNRLDVVRKNYLFLHSWELLILSCVFLFYYPNSYLIAIVTGFVYHVMLDQIFNSLFMGRYGNKLLFYFLLYRLSWNFDVLSLKKGPLDAKEAGERY